MRLPGHHTGSSRVGLRKLFVRVNVLDFPALIEVWMKAEIPNNYRLWTQILSQEPVDEQLVSVVLSYPLSVISSQELFWVGAYSFLASPLACVSMQKRLP